MVELAAWLKFLVARLQRLTKAALQNLLAAALQLLVVPAAVHTHGLLAVAFPCLVGKVRLVLVARSSCTLV